MASITSFFFFFLLLLTLSSTIHARESQFFAKISNNIPKEVQPLNTNQQDPNFIPQTQPDGGAYGLYGHESGQLPPSATANNFPLPANLPENYNPVAYTTPIHSSTQDFPDEFNDQVTGETGMYNSEKQEMGAKFASGGDMYNSANPPDSSENSPLSVSTSHPIPNLISPTSVRVRIKSISLNYATYLQVLGKYQEKFPLPFVLGSDYSGVVESVGPNVTKFKIGDRICAHAGVGSFAQYIVAEEHELYGVPDGCDLVAAAAIPVAYGTSHQALVHRANLKSDQVLLVLGAAGGVGLAAVQIGKVRGAIVIAVARGTEKVEFLKSMGVDHAVDLSKGGVIESVKSFLKTKKLKGVDVVYDPVGGKLMKESMKLLNWGAQILVIGFASGEVPVIPANIALVKNWTIHGVYWGNYETNRPGVVEDSLKELLSWLARGLITIYMSRSYKLQEAYLAFLEIKDRKVIGKVMITVDDPKTIPSSRL